MGPARPRRLEEVARQGDRRRRFPTLAGRGAPRGRGGTARGCRPAGDAGSRSVDAGLGVALPESAVFALPADAGEPLSGAVREELEAADAVLVGPGFDDPDETRATLRAVAETEPSCLVLDAFALGVLPDLPRHLLIGSLVLNPNVEEAELLLGRALGEDRASDILEIARRYDAVVNCYGVIAHPGGETWNVSEGGPGLGTSGSGDVLAGAITGFTARGLDPARAAVWGSWAHARAGDRLTARHGIGFLARDIPSELTAAVTEALDG